MREEMRKSDDLTEWPLRHLVVERINELVATTPNSEQAWEKLSSKLSVKYDLDIFYLSFFFLYAFFYDSQYRLQNAQRT